MLVTDVGNDMCWWQLWDVGNGFSPFRHQHPLSFNISVGYQHPKHVTNIKIPSTTPNCHQNLCSPELFFPKQIIILSPINMSCLNSVEVGLLVMVCLCYLGFFLLVLYLIKYYRMLKSDKYATKQKLRSNSNTSADAIIPSNRDTSITLTKTNQTESFA